MGTPWVRRPAYLWCAPWATVQAKDAIKAQAQLGIMDRSKMPQRADATQPGSSLGPMTVTQIGKNPGLGRGRGCRPVREFVQMSA